jgi:hypothetical protein
MKPDTQIAISLSIVFFFGNGMPIVASEKKQATPMANAERAQIYRLPPKKFGAENEWYQSVDSFLKNTDCSGDDWKTFLADFGSGIDDFELKKRARVIELADKTLAETERRFGAHSLQSRMAHMDYAIALALSEQKRRAWDEYDLYAPALEGENVEFLVLSLRALGLAFGHGSDAIHAFQLGDELISKYTVSEVVQAQFYNYASDSVFRSLNTRDDNIKPFFKYAQKAIQLDEKLGSDFYPQLREVKSLLDGQLQQDAERKKWAEEHKPEGGK